MKIFLENMIIQSSVVNFYLPVVGVCFKADWWDVGCQCVCDANTCGLWHDKGVILWWGRIGDCYLSIFVAVGLEGLFCRGWRGSMVLWNKKYGPEKFFGLNGMKHADQCSLGWILYGMMLCLSNRKIKTIHLCVMMQPNNIKHTRLPLIPSLLLSLLGVVQILVFQAYLMSLYLHFIAFDFLHMLEFSHGRIWYGTSCAKTFQDCTAYAGHTTRVFCVVPLWQQVVANAPGEQLQSLCRQLLCANN